MMIVSDYAIGDASEDMISISLLSRASQAHRTINLTCIPVCFSSYTAWVLVTFFYRDGVWGDQRSTGWVRDWVVWGLAGQTRSWGSWTSSVPNFCTYQCWAVWKCTQVHGTEFSHFHRNRIATVSFKHFIFHMIFVLGQAHTTSVHACLYIHQLFLHRKCRQMLTLSYQRTLPACCYIFHTDA